MRLERAILMGVGVIMLTLVTTGMVLPTHGGMTQVTVRSARCLATENGSAGSIGPRGRVHAAGEVYVSPRECRSGDLMLRARSVESRRTPYHAVGPTFGLHLLGWMLAAIGAIAAMRAVRRPRVRPA